MTTIEDQRTLCDKLRSEMHSVPMNPIFQTHTGHRFLGNHSMAWAKASRAWSEAIDRLAKMESNHTGRNEI